MNGPDFVDANNGRLVMTVVSCKRSNSGYGLSLLGLQSMCASYNVLLTNHASSELTFALPVDAFGDLKALRVLDSGAQVNQELSGALVYPATDLSFPSGLPGRIL